MIENGRVVHGLANANAFQFVHTMNRWFNDGILNQDYGASGGYARLNSHIANHEIGATFRFAGNIGRFARESQPGINLQTDISVMQLVNPPVANTHGERLVLGRSPLGEIFGITRFAQDPEKVFAFLDWLYSDEAQFVRNAGFEGEDWTRNADGSISFTEVFRANADGYRMNRGVSNFFLPFWMDYANIFLDALSITLGPVHSRDVVEMDNFLYVPFQTNTFREGADAAALRRDLGDIETFINESIHSFIMGTRPLSEWNAYLATLNALNLPAVLAIYQKSVS
jgi:putative aldouronate transport system substrate-binding protein